MHGSKHTIEFNRNRIQWERVIRKPGHDTFNSLFRETSQIQRLPASNIWERSNNVDTNTVQFAKQFIVSHEPHGDWFEFRSCQRVVTVKGVEKFMFAGRKLFHHGRQLQHIHDVIETGSSDAHRRSPPDHRQEVGEADQHPWSYTSFVQDLTLQRQVLQPSCTSHSSFRQDATLGSRHEMIPTWQRSRSR